MLETADAGHFEHQHRSVRARRDCGRSDVPLPHVERLTAVAGSQTQQPCFSNRRSGIRERPQIAKTSAKQPAETISKGRGRRLGSQFCVHARRQWISNDVPANGRSARIYGKDRTHYSEISGGHRYRELHPPNLRGTLHTTIDKHRCKESRLSTIPESTRCSHAASVNLGHCC